LRRSGTGRAVFGSGMYCRLGECIGSAGNGRLPPANQAPERAWYSHLDPGPTALPWSPWRCLIVCQSPRPTRRCQLAFAFGKDGGLVTFKRVVGWHMANGATQSLPIIDHDKPVDRLVSFSGRGVSLVGYTPSPATCASAQSCRCFEVSTGRYVRLSHRIAG
jgi:hypothetical protein